MAKYNLRSPKYIIPLIVFPFAILINFLVLDMNEGFGKENTVEEIRLKENEGISIEMPTPSETSKGEITDKFGSFNDMFKNRTDVSAVQEISREDILADDFESNYTQKEKSQIDSLNQIIAKTRSKNSLEYNRAKYVPQTAVTDPINEPDMKLKAETNEMEQFKKQMIFIDSLTRANEKPNQEPEEEGFLEYAARKKNIDDSVRLATEAKAERVKLAALNNQDLFNTIMPETSSKLITAMLDEGLKVYNGSRIKIRLLDDITIGDYFLSKNTILFGLVSGFGAQRVKVEIGSLIIGEDIVTVDLSIYDNDGIEGIFVPDNTFRQFATELASRGAQQNQISIQEDPESTNQFLYSLFNNSVRQASQATAKQIRKQKANFKYGTQLYLIDNSN